MKHIIKWDPNAHTIVRGCAEPYELKEEYQDEIDRKMLSDPYRPFKIPSGNSIVD